MTREPLLIPKPNRMAQLIDEERRNPGAIGRNAEALRRACRDYYDDGSERACKKIRRRHR